MPGGSTGIISRLMSPCRGFVIPFQFSFRPSLLACTLALAACAAQTPLPTLPAQTPAAWRGTDAQMVSNPNKPDLATWWREFDDAQLDTLIDSALNDNLGIAVAALRLRAARRLEHHAQTAFWPNLNFRVYEETAPGASTGYFEVGFDAEWELGLFGRAQGNARMAAADANLAAIDDAAARVSVCAEVARTYVELRAAQARAGIANELITARRRRAALVAVQVRTRLAAPIDAERAGAELQQALAEASEPATSAHQAAAALAVLLGKIEPDSAWAQAAPQPVLPELGIAQAPADLVRTRPEIRRAEQNVMRAAGELGIARADLFPKFGLVGSLISATALTGDVDHPNKAVPLLGPTVQLPIWDWGARRDVVDAREAALAASVLAYREAVLEGIADVESALAAFAEKSRREHSAAAELTTAAHGAQAAQTLKRLGLGDDLDDVQGQLAYLDAGLRQVNARRDRALAFIALYKAFGGAMPPLEQAP